MSNKVMKTNVTLQSQDRELFGVRIRQQTQGSFLSLTDLEEAYTQARVRNGWADKNITRILNDNTEVLYYLLEKQGFIKVPMCTFMENIESQGFAKHMKSLGVYKTTGARHTKSVWVNPYIFVMVAMELNPIFKAQVIDWLTDSLIINRIEAGSFYRDLSKAINTMPNPDYVKIAKGLNWIVFNKHETGLRNTATQKELAELKSIEENLAFAINMGYIKTNADLLNTMRKMYNKKYFPN